MAGDVLFREGDRGYDFIVILAGQVTVLDHQAGVERELATGGPGEFVAELNVLTGERLFTTAVVTQAGAVLVVPVTRLHAVIGQDQGLGQWIIRTLFARREWLMQRKTGLRIVGSRTSPQTRRLLEFVGRNRLPHVWLDTDTDPAAGVVLAHHKTPVAQTPVVVMRGGELLRQPSNAELARAAGVGTGPVAGLTYDVAIIGAGLDRFAGLGVFYSPLTVHDEIRAGDPVVIVGGGNSAGQAAIWLAGRGHRVTIVIRGTDLAESMSHYLTERITGRADIEVRYHSVVLALDGGERLERIEVEDTATKTRETVPAAALVVLVGAEPHTQWLAGSVLLDDGGYIITGPGLGPDTRHESPWTGRNHDPYLLETSAPGVFAAGDIRSGSVKRAAAAVGEGSIAVRFVSEYLGRRAGFATVPAPGGGAPGAT
jgi:hypothetical protein